MSLDFLKNVAQAITLRFAKARVISASKWKGKGMGISLQFSQSSSCHRTGLRPLHEA